MQKCCGPTLSLLLVYLVYNLHDSIAGEVLATLPRVLGSLAAILAETVICVIKPLGLDAAKDLGMLGGNESNAKKLLSQAH